MVSSLTIDEKQLDIRLLAEAKSNFYRIEMKSRKKKTKQNTKELGGEKRTTESSLKTH